MTLPCTIADAPEGGKRRGDRWIPALLLLAAAALRAWTIVSLRTDLRITDPVLDGRYYLDLAARLARGDGWPPGPIFMTPLYPALLSGLVRLLGPGVAGVQVFQSLLGLASLWLLLVVARRDLGRGAAIGAGVLYVLSGPILAMENQVFTESLLLFLALVAMWTWPGRNRAAWSPAAFGVTCGLLALGRGTFLLLPLAWLAMVHPVGAVRAAGTGRTIRTVGMVVAGVAIALAPLAVRQSRATGRLQLLTLNGGLNLFLGNNPVALGFYSLPPWIDLEKDITGARSLSVTVGRELGPVEADAEFARRARAFFRERPGRAAWLLWRKALLFLSPREIPQIEYYEALRDDTPPLRAAFADFRWLLPLAVLGAAGLVHAGRKSEVAPWLALVLVGWLTTIAFFATGRYRVPFLPGFLGLAGAGAAEILSVVRSRARRLPWRWAVVPLVVGVQLVLPSFSRGAARGFDALQLGLREARRGRPAEALRRYEEAARLDPALGEARHGMGVALVQQGRLPEAVQAYREALRLIPASPVTHYNLGAVYGRLGDDTAALAEFRAAVRLDPFEPAYRSDLAVALARTGDDAGAVEEFRTVLRSRPDFAPARRGLEMLTRPGKGR